VWHLIEGAELIGTKKQSQSKEIENILGRCLKEAESMKRVLEELTLKGSWGRFRWGGEGEGDLGL
jgi:hypothetical protein